MKKNADIFVRHILDSVEQIEKYTKGISYEDFLASRQIQDAVIRRFEIIGEAMKNIPDDFTGKALNYNFHRPVAKSDPPHFNGL